MCRLCWRNAERLHPPRQTIDVVEANRHGQQLFLADLQKLAGARTAPAACRVNDGREAVHDPHQLRLFDPRRPIAHPRLDELMQLARDHAATHGWSHKHSKRLRTAVRKVLVAHAGDRQIRASAVMALFAGRDLPVGRTLELLTAAGMLDDDRIPAIEGWFERQVCGLPVTMADELRIWFDVLRHGATTPPRRRPRSPITAKLCLRAARSTLHAWAQAGHRSLREISRADIEAALPPSGTPRAALGLALRSIFSTLKARKVIFVNPTARIPIGEIERRQPLPVDVERLRSALNSPDPTRAAMTALIAFHGLRSSELRALHLTDVRDGRLHIGARKMPVAAPVTARLSAYLDYRSSRWPGSVNPHLFVTARSAIGTGPVGGNWIWRTLDIPASTLRQDRILDEAIATRGDVRRLCDLFDITVRAALHYTTIIEHPDLEG